MSFNEGHGDAIFLTWSGALKDLPKVKVGARAMAANGTTFRGCSFDGRVFVKDRCPVCGQWGLNEVDTPWDIEEVRKGPVGAPRAHWQPRKRKAR